MTNRLGLLGRRPAFRGFWAARVLSELGDGAAQIALVLLVSARPRGGLAVGGVLLASGLPRLLGPAAGALADRLDRRSVMVVCDLLQALLYLLVAVLLPPYAALLALVAVASALEATYSPASHSVAPALVAEDELGPANALLGLALNLRVLLAPVIGAGLVATAGVRAALLADVASFLLSALLVLRIPALTPRSRAPRSRRLLAAVSEGLGYAARHPVLRPLVGALFLAVAFGAMDNVALVFLARQAFGAGAAGYGVLVTAFGLGMVLASLGLARAGRRLLPPGRALLVGLAASGAGVLLTGAAPALGVAVACQALAGAGNGLETVALDTVVQRAAPAHILGRVFGVIATMVFLGGSVASLAGGLLLDVAPARAVFVVAGSGSLAALAGLLLALPAARGWAAGRTPETGRDRTS